jgi:hypothetical protein
LNLVLLNPARDKIGLFSTVWLLLTKKRFLISLITLNLSCKLDRIFPKITLTFYNVLKVFIPNLTSGSHNRATNAFRDRNISLASSKFFSLPTINATIKLHIRLLKVVLVYSDFIKTTILYFKSIRRENLVLDFLLFRYKLVINIILSMRVAAQIMQHLFR